MKTSMCCRLMATGNHKTAPASAFSFRDELQMRPPMDLWIMGLLYKLIVRGSRPHGAFGEKGLARSVYPTGGMCGRSPVCGVEDSVFGCRDKKGGDRERCE